MQKVFEQLWLAYYNDALYEKGVITEDERNKMRLKIEEYISQKDEDDLPVAASS